MTHARSLDTPLALGASNASSYGTTREHPRHPTFFNHFRDFRRRYAVALND